jgi:hypothetical protein
MPKGGNKGAEGVRKEEIPLKKKHVGFYIEEAEGDCTMV